MALILYNENNYMMRAENDKYPHYRLNLMRRRCFEYLVLQKEVPEKYKEIIDNGGIGAMKAIIVDQLPQELLHHYGFFCYQFNKQICDWLQQHPGRKIIPIVDMNGYNIAMSHIGKQNAESHWG